MPRLKLCPVTLRQAVDFVNEQLRHNYPHLCELLLKWDSDSPTTFKANGKTVHDYDRRFQLEDEGFINENERFLWSFLEDPYKQLTFY